MKKSLYDYKNFWLIWLNCASKKEGVSLFQIQNSWGIRTNYLYHNETGLGKPLFRSMVSEGYIEKHGKRLVAKFGWIPEFMGDEYRPPETYETGTSWSPNSMINSKWPEVQEFMERNSEKLLGQDKLRLLYRRDKEIIGAEGRNIFLDILLFILLMDVRKFTMKYKADVVMRISSTLLSLSAQRDIVNYLHRLSVELSGKGLPELARNESELSAMLCNLRW